MGHASDDMEVLAWQYEAQLEHKEELVEKVNTHIWTCRDGQKVHLKDMTDSHITHTVRLLAKSNSFEAALWIHEFKHEQQRRIFELG
jgi:hypothetical protein